jgi:hypothetical protein
MVNRVDLPETGHFSLLARVESANGDTTFQGILWFGETFPLEPEGVLVFFEVSVYGRGADFYKFFRDFIGDTEGLPPCDERHLGPHKGREDFPALVPEKVPDESETGDDLFGIDPLAFPVRGPLFFRLEFHRLSVRIKQKRFGRFGA